MWKASKCAFCRFIVDIGDLIRYANYRLLIICEKGSIMLFHSIEEVSEVLCFEVGPSGSCILLGV